MNRIMVVDDEAIQRRVLGKMIREARSGCEVMEAGNGKAALELARSQSFDVVITDIRMPIMDGFGFIEHMKEIAPDCKIIILSGFRYFEYAQKAVQLGAFDYLLKPVKEESIGELLNKVEDTIRKEKQQSMEQQAIRQQLDSSLNVYYEHLLQQWMLGGITGSQFEDIRQQFALWPCGTVAVTKVEEDPTEPLSAERLEEIRKALPGILSSLIGSGCRAVSFVSPDDKRTLITVLTQADGWTEPMNLMTDSLRKFGGHLSEQYRVLYTIGVGTLRNNLDTHAAQAYREAVEAAAYAYFFSSDQVLSYSEIAVRMQPMHDDFSKEEELLKDSIRAMKWDAVERHAEELFSRAVAGGLPNPLQWKQAVIHVLYNIAAAMKDFISEEDYRSTRSEIEKRISTSFTFREGHQAFLETLRQFMTVLESRRTRKHETVVESCVRYIDEHFMDDLSLDSVAQQLFFSPNYLSMMFKNHLGVSFTKYLAEVRLRKAIRMLENGDMKVYEIAGKVGFKDEKYFYRVFKTKFGMTPDDYRKNSALNRTGTGETSYANRSD